MIPPHYTGQPVLLGKQNPHDLIWPVSLNIYLSPLLALCFELRNVSFLSFFRHTHIVSCCAMLVTLHCLFGGTFTCPSQFTWLFPCIRLTSRVTCFWPFLSLLGWAEWSFPRFGYSLHHLYHSFLLIIYLSACCPHPGSACPEVKDCHSSLNPSSGRESLMNDE